MKLSLVLTHGCPLRCTYCYAGSKQGTAMSEGIARTAIDLGLEHAHLGVLMLCFMGGEALLEPDLLIEAMRYARSEAKRLGKKVFFQLTTSGVGLDDRLAQVLCREKVQVTLSLDGDLRAHDPRRRLTSGRGSHALGVAALKTLRSAGLTPDVNSVVHPGNVGRLERSLRFLLTLGFRRLTFSPDFLVTWTPAQIETYRSGLEAQGALLLERARGGDPLCLNPLSTLMIRRTRWWRRGQLRCGFGLRELAVAPSGALYPCDRLVSSEARPEHNLGHLLQGGLDRRRQKAAYASSRDLPEECKRCPLKKVCSRSCGGTNLLGSGDASRPTATFCALEMAGIEVADQLLEASRRASSSQPSVVSQRPSNVPRGTLGPSDKCLAPI